MTRKLPWIVPAVVVLATGGVRASTPLPGWYGQPGTTRQGYWFDSSSLTPSANIMENPYQTPVASVSPGAFSDGWQDPMHTIDLSGVLLDGAWDLGIAGSITVVCQVAANPPAPGTHYRVDFEVYAVAYRGITALPSLDTLGLLANDLVLTQTLVAEDPEFPGASWQGRMWTGYFESLQTNTVSFAVKAPSNNTSVVDTYEVFTKVTLIPEPSLVMLSVVSALGWSLRRRRD